MYLITFDYFSKFLMFSTFNHIQTCKAGRVNLTAVVVSNEVKVIRYCT